MAGKTLHSHARISLAFIALSQVVKSVFPQLIQEKLQTRCAKVIYSFCLALRFSPKDDNRCAALPRYAALLISLRPFQPSDPSDCPFLTILSLIDLGSILHPPSTFVLQPNHRHLSTQRSHKRSSHSTRNSGTSSNLSCSKQHPRTFCV
jgi:hypothetical protein